MSWHNVFYIAMGIQFAIAAVFWERGNGTFESFTLAWFGVYLILKGVSSFV